MIEEGQASVTRAREVWICRPFAGAHGRCARSAPNDDTHPPMRLSAATPARIADIGAEIDQARRGGPLQRLVIPACPTLLTRLRAALAQGEPDLSEVARIASSDVAMAAALIQTANAPAHAVGPPTRTVGQAMNRLGLQQTAATMTAFLARRSIRADSPHLRRFWERSSRRAAAMVFIARRLPGLSPDLAHTVGLFLHVGQPVLLQSMLGYGGTLAEAAARTDRSFVATENANHRTDHAVVGALVARVWRLAPEVMAAVRLHHDLAGLVACGTEPEVATLVAASLVAEQLMRQHEGLPSDEDWARHAAVACDWLQVGPDELLDWQDEIAPTLDAA